MKKLSTLVPAALLPPPSAGCSGSSQANDASENVGEAAQASTLAGSWSGLPVTGNAQWGNCFVSSGGVNYEFSLKLNSVETSSVNVYDVIVYVSDSSGTLYYTITQSNYALSEGGTMNFSDSEDSYFQVVAGTDAHGNMTLTVQNGYFSYDGLMLSCTAHVMSPTASASGVGLLGTPWIGSTLTGYYTFSDDDGLSESGSTFQWYLCLPAGTPTAISGATGTTYTASSADLGDTLEFCVTPADANGPGVQVCSSPTSMSAAYSAVASNVAISGNPYPGSTLTGSYTFSDGDHLSETSVAYQWYTVSGSTLTPISGATSATYTPATNDVNNQIEFCVTPSDSFGPGAQACSSTVTVAGVVWYSGESWTGTAIGETSSNGTCVTVSSLDLGFTPASLALYSVDDLATSIYMYTGSNLLRYAVLALRRQRHGPRHQPRHRGHRLEPRLLQDHLVM